MVTNTVNDVTSNDYLEIGGIVPLAVTSIAVNLLAIAPKYKVDKDYDVTTHVFTQPTQINANITLIKSRFEKEKLEVMKSKKQSVKVIASNIGVFNAMMIESLIFKEDASQNTVSCAITLSQTNNFPDGTSPVIVDPDWPPKPSDLVVDFASQQKTGTNNTYLFKCTSPTDVKTYSWTFGDGNSSTDPAPEHTYSGTVIPTPKDKGTTESRWIEISNQFYDSLKATTCYFPNIPKDDMVYPQTVYGATKYYFQLFSATLTGSTMMADYVYWLKRTADYQYKMGSYTGQPFKYDIDTNSGMNPITYMEISLTHSDVSKGICLRELFYDFIWELCHNTQSRASASNKWFVLFLKSGSTEFRGEMMNKLDALIASTDISACTQPSEYALVMDNLATPMINLVKEFGIGEGTGGDTPSTSGYTVLLKVTDSNGKTGTKSKQLSASGGVIPLPVPSDVAVDFTMSGDTKNCTSVTFTCITPPTQNIKSYLWDFGDGNTSTDAEPLHIFSQNTEFISTDSPQTIIESLDPNVYDIECKKAIDLLLTRFGMTLTSKALLAAFEYLLLHSHKSSLSTSPPLMNHDSIRAYIDNTYAFFFQKICSNPQLIQSTDPSSKLGTNELTEKFESIISKLALSSTPTNFIEITKLISPSMSTLATDIISNKTVTNSTGKYSVTLTVITTDERTGKCTQIVGDPTPNDAIFPAFTTEELSSLVYEGINSNPNEAYTNVEGYFTLSEFNFNRLTGEISCTCSIPNSMNYTKTSTWSVYLKLPDHYKCKGKTIEIAAATDRSNTQLFAPPSIVCVTFEPPSVTPAGSGSCNYLTDARNTTATDYKELTFEQMKKIIAANTRSLSYFKQTSVSGNSTISESDIYYDRKNGVITFFGVNLFSSSSITHTLDIKDRNAIMSLMGKPIILFSYSAGGWHDYYDFIYFAFRYKMDSANAIIDALTLQIPTGSVIIQKRAFDTEGWQLFNLSQTYSVPENRHSSDGTVQKSMDGVGGIRLVYLTPGNGSYIPRIFRLVLSDTYYKTGSPDDPNVS